MLAPSFPSSNYHTNFTDLVSWFCSLRPKSRRGCSILRIKAFTVTNIDCYKLNRNLSVATGSNMCSSLLKPPSSAGVRNACPTTSSVSALFRCVIHLSSKKELCSPIPFTAEDDSYSGDRLRSVPIVLHTLEILRSSNPTLQLPTCSRIQLFRKPIICYRLAPADYRPRICHPGKV